MKPRLLAFSLVWGLYSSVPAATVTWVGGNGEWNDPNNWSSAPELPNPNDDIMIDNGTVAVVGGLILNGTAYLGNQTNISSYGQLSLKGSQALSGIGTVMFGPNPCNAILADSGTTLTNQLILRGHSGRLGQAAGFCFGGFGSGVALVNEGSISADMGGGTITIDAEPFTNRGLVRSPRGTISLAGWIGVGGLGTFDSTGGSVQLLGYLDNSNGILLLDGLSNTLQMQGGYIFGGTVRVRNSAQLLFGNGILDTVTTEGDLHVSNGVAVVLNGLVLNGTAYLGNQTNNSSYGYLSFEGSQVLTGTGTVLFGPNPCNAILPRSGTTLTNQLTIRGHSGQLGYPPSACFVHVESAVALVNEGIISADMSGGTITINAEPFTNAGLLRSPQGTINLAGSISVGGLGTFESAGGMLWLTGLLHNTNAFLRLDGPSNVLQLQGGTILGGTLSQAHGGQFLFGRGILDGITIEGDLDLVDGVAVVRNGLVLNGTMYLGNQTNNGTFGYLSCNGSQALGGNGTMVLGPHPCNAILANYGSILTNQLTIRGHSGVLGQAASVCFGPFVSQVTLVNEGVISADTMDGNININADLFVNAGLMQALNGGRLTFSGNHTVAGGSFNVGINTSTIYGTIHFLTPFSASGDFTAVAVDGFRPNPGEIFTILSYVSATNDFTCYQLNLGSGFVVVPDFSRRRLALTVRAAPTNATQPRLFISRSLTDLRLTWPLGFPTWVLESTPNLGTPTWAPLTTQCENQAVVRVESESYYRLSETSFTRRP